MEKEFLPYSNSINLEAIRTIGKGVVLDIAPDEKLSSEKLINRIIQANEQGNVLVADTSSKEAGGFGNVDLLTLVIVPLIVVTLGEICKQLVVWSIQELKDWLKKNKENKKKMSELVDVVVEQKYEEVSGKVKSRKSRSKENSIRKATKFNIKMYFDLE